MYGLTIDWFYSAPEHQNKDAIELLQIWVPENDGKCPEPQGATIAELTTKRRWQILKVVRILELHSTDLEVQSCGVKIISDLMEGLLPRLIPPAVYTVLIRALKTFSNQGDDWLTTLKLLRTMAVNGGDENFRVMVKHFAYLGVFSEVQKALKQYSSLLSREIVDLQVKLAMERVASCLKCLEDLGDKNKETSHQDIPFGVFLRTVEPIVYIRRTRSFYLDVAEMSTNFLAVRRLALQDLGRIINTLKDTIVYPEQTEKGTQGVYVVVSMLIREFQYIMFYTPLSLHIH